MKWIVQPTSWFRHGKPPQGTTGEMAVYMANRYNDDGGQLERLEHQVENLEKLLERVIDVLPEDLQRKLVAQYNDLVEVQE